MIWKCCTQYANKYGKLSSGHRTGKKVLILIPKEGNAKECSYYHRIALISHGSNIMLKILRARLQQYVNQELSDVQDGFRKGRGTNNQNADIYWITEKAREFQKHIYFCFIDYTKAFDCADLNNLWKIPIEMGIPTKLLASWETCIQVKKRQVRTRHGATDCFKIGKGVHQGCTLSLCLFNFMHSTPCRMPSWMTHKLESRLPGEISSTSNIHKMPL